MHQLDPLGQRPVSANQNSWLGPNTPLDVQGIDYATSSYDKVRPKPGIYRFLVLVVPGAGTHVRIRGRVAASCTSAERCT